MRRAACIALLALTACQDTEESSPELGDTIRVFAWPEHPLPNEESFDVVAETFGMEVVISDHWHGSIALYFSEHVDSGGYSGLATGPSCSPHISLSTSANQLVLAHEIGHTLGLAHVDTPLNLMNIDDPDFDLDDEQIRFARERAWEIESCRN